MSFEEDLMDEESQTLLEKRETARQNKDFAQADRLRDELLARGYKIIDTPQGPRWQRINS